jgi:hypothetical protein
LPSKTRFLSRFRWCWAYDKIGGSDQTSNYASPAIAPGYFFCLEKAGGVICDEVCGIMTARISLCYMGAIKKLIAIRVSPATAAKLRRLSDLHGTQAEAVAVAIDRLYESAYAYNTEIKPHE